MYINTLYITLVVLLFHPISSQFLNCTKGIEILSENYINETDLECENLAFIPSHIGKLSQLTSIKIRNSDAAVLPAEFFELSELERVDLRGNKFSTNVYTEFGKLKKLTYLDLSLSGWYGYLPTELGDLESLKHLDLSSTKVRRIPSTIGNLINLEFLNLFNTTIKSSLPIELQYLTNLRILNANDAELTGRIDPSLSKLESLEILELGDNKLIGTIPSSLGNLTQLLELSLDDNRLTNTIPSELGNLVNLKRWDLEYNNFIGTLPISIGNLEQLTHFSVHHNHIRGQLPDTLERLSNLDDFRVSENQFTGRIPRQALGNMKKLVILHLFNNEFEPTQIPTEVGLMSDLEIFRMDGVGFKSEIPSEFGNLKSLKIWRASSSDLRGTIPTELGKMTKLEKIALSRNFLTGTIPTELGRLTRLTMFQFEDNNLSGTIPTQLGELSKVTGLQFDSNSLTGTIPTELEMLTKATTLDFQNNKLSGTIPTFIVKMRKLVKVLWNDNLLTGSIPSEIGNLNKTIVYKINLSNNLLQSTIPTELFQLTYLSTLMLSKNSFVGTIPTEIGNLKRLKYAIMKENNLSGALPSQLFELPNMIQIDFRRNSLSGELPSSVGTFTSLKYLRLSYNNLYGALPPGFGSFIDLSAVEIDNTNLTWFPLPPNFRRMRSDQSIGGQHGSTGCTDFRFNFEQLNMEQALDSLLPLRVTATAFQLGGSLRKTGRNVIPTTIGIFDSLTTLDLRNNNISSTIPSEISLLTKLDLFIIDGNRITGSIPSSVKHMVCGPGTFDTGDLQVLQQYRQCSKCPKGTHQPYIGSSTCLPCPEGTYADEEGLIQCKICSRGIVNGGRKSCDICEKTTYLQDGMCVPCPDNMVTREEGAFSISDCISSIGFFKINPEDNRQYPVPNGTYGNVSGLTVETLQLANGYWRSSQRSIKVYPCLSGDKFCAGSTNNNSSYCVDGHTGLFCESCVSGHVKRGSEGECAQCDNSITKEDRKKFFVVLLLTTIAIVMFTVAFIMYKSRRASPDYDATKFRTKVTDYVSIKIRILIGFFQVLDAYISLFAISSDSDYFKSLQNTMQYLYLGLYDFFVSFCYTGNNHLVSIYIAFVIPIYTSCVIAAVHFAASLLQRHSRNTYIMSSLVDAIIFVLFLAYPYVCRVAIQSFECVAVESFEVLKVDYQIDCDSKEYQVGYSISIFLLVLYHVIIIGSAIVFYRRQESPDIINRPYKKDFSLFEYEQVVMKFIQTSLIVVIYSSNTMMQIGFSMIFCFIAVTIITVVQPYRRSSDSILATVVQFQLIVSAVLFLGEHEQMDTSLTMLFTTIVSPIVFAVQTLVYVHKLKKRGPVDELEKLPMQEVASDGTAPGFEGHSVVVA